MAGKWSIIGKSVPISIKHEFCLIENREEHVAHRNTEKFLKRHTQNIYHE